MKTIKLYKKYKKLINGGDSLINPQGGQPSVGQTVGSFLGPTGQSISGISQMGTGVASAIQQSNQDEFGVAKNENLNVGAGIMGSMADPTRKLSVLGDDRFSTGEKLASFIPGGIGTIAYGVMKSKKDNESAKKEKEQFLNNEKLNTINNQRNTFNQAVSNGFQVQGNMNAQKYAKNGGVLSTMYKNGGNVQQLSKTNVQFNGNSHENGGIKEPLVNGVKLNEVEVEGNESMSTSNGQKFVFSDNLGFAQQHKPLAKAMGKIEKYLKSNPNDPIRKRTLNSLKEREEQLKVKQEETKEALGLENNLGEMRLGGAIKRKDGVYIDREGVMKYPLKNGGLTKYAPGGPVDLGFDPYKDYRLSFTNGDTYAEQMYLNSRGANLNVDGKKGPLTQAAANKFSNRPTPILKSELSQSPQYVIGAPRPDNNDPEISGLNTSNMSKYVESPTQGIGKASINTPSSKVNWGNVAGKIIPYVGAASNYMLNEKARKMTTPKEALPDYVKYKPVDYSASKIEADQQRRQLNKSLTQNVTNSAVAAALKAKNLGTTIGAKNLINQEEMNINTQGINQNNLVNNQIQQRRNQIDVENRDRDYNKEQRYLTQKGEIANNFSDIYQQQGRDSKLYDLEDRKIDVLAKQDAARDVWYRNFLEDQKKQKESHKNGGLIKKSSKLYSKMKK